MRAKNFQNSRHKYEAERFRSLSALPACSTNGKTSDRIFVPTKKEKKKINERKSSSSNNNDNDKRNYPESLKEPNVVVSANREKVSEQAS